MKGYYTAGFTFIDNLTGGKLTNIKNQFSEKMSGVANAVSSGMSAAKNYASTQLSNMQAAYQSSGGGIKGIVAATMTGVQGTFSTAYSVINNLDCQHFFRQIFLGYFSDIVQAFDTLRKNVCGDDYTSLHNPIVLSSVLPAYGMFHSIQILFL